MPTSTTTGPAAARATARRRIAGDRGRHQAVVVSRGDGTVGGSAGGPGGGPGVTHEAEHGDRLALVTESAAPEVLTSDDPLDPPQILPPEPDDDAEAAPPTTAPAEHRPAWIVVALAVSLIAVLGACVLATLTTRAHRADLSAGDSALAAAKPDTARILSYDYRRLDADFAAATAVTTGSFRTDYQATTARAVKALATQTQAVVAAKVVAGGVVSSSANHATLLLFVNQTTTSNRLSSAKTDLTRVQVTMTRSGSRWLVSGLKAL
jgi:Mce-associated membrane protein